MINQFQSAFKVDMTTEVQTLMDVTDQLDKILFDDYVKRKSAEVAKIIQKGVLGGTIDWFRAEKPTGPFALPPQITKGHLLIQLNDNRGSSVYLRRVAVSRSRSFRGVGYRSTASRSHAR